MKAILAKGMILRVYLRGHMHHVGIPGNDVCGHAVHCSGAQAEVEPQGLWRQRKLRHGRQAGVPGTAYAKILQEFWTEVTPTGSYWNPTRILSDNRIPAMGSDKTTYTFQSRETLKTAKISATLLYRRAFIEIMDQKGWEAPDIIMEKETIELP